MKKLFLILGISICLQACLVSRLARPKITGYVLDAQTHEPISDCKVGEVLTDSVGYYELKEKKYRQFTGIGMEASPLFIWEVIEKEGYINDTIQYQNPFGGGARKGTQWQMDTLFLKRKE